MQLAEAVQEFLLAYSGVKSPATVALYRSDLRHLVEVLGAERDITTIQLPDLRRWRAQLVARRSKWGGRSSRPAEAAPCAPATIHRQVRQVRRFFRWLQEEEYLTENPARRLELPQLPAALPKAATQEDMVLMLREARATSARDYAILCVLVDTACRVGGLIGLRLGDLDLANGEAVVREKGQKSRAVFLSAPTVRAIRAYLAERSALGSDVLFLGRRGGPMTKSGVYRALERIAERAGVTGRFNPHSFRHGAARAMLQNGADLGTVSRLLGHSDIETTHRHYAVWAQSELKDSHRRTSWMTNVDDGEGRDET